MIIETNLFQTVARPKTGNCIPPQAKKMNHAILCSRSACDTFTIIIFYCRRCVILMLNVEHVMKFPQVIPQYDGLVTMLMYLGNVTGNPRVSQPYPWKP